MFKKIWVPIVILMLLFAATTIARADAPDLGFPWNNHEDVYDFTFGNLIDSHQQTRLLNNGRLQGYIYIQFTGETINGTPVARRANCDNPDLDCRVGWEVIGVPIEGVTLVQKGPRLWDIPEENLPSDPEFTHFHWTGTPKKPCGLVLNDVTYSGYLFKRMAVDTFYWLGGNEDKEAGRLVTPGLDLQSNLEGRWTRGEGGGCGSHETGDDTGCGGSDMGSEPGGCGGGETGGDTGCGGSDMGGEPGGCGGGETGGDTGCGGSDMGGEPGGCGGGETGGDTGCGGSDMGGEPGGCGGGETGGDTGCGGSDMGGEPGGCGGA